MTRWMPLALLVLTGASPGSSAPADPIGDPVAGEAVAATCVPCHGAEGRSEDPQWPRLAGQPRVYLAKELGDFRSGARTDPSMSAMAATLADQQVLDVAAYFSSRARVASRSEPSTEGARVYLKGRPGVMPCVGCHESRGLGYDVVFGGVPAIGGQHADYVRKQLVAFRAGERANDQKGVMRAVAGKLTDDEIAAVAAFVAGLR